MAALAILVATASCAANNDPAPPSTTKTPVVTSALSTTVSVPLRRTNFFDPVDIATSFMINYASGTIAIACRFMSDEYGKTEAQAGRCSGLTDVERLPVVTLVDSCKLPDESYRVRFTVVPGVGASPLPIEGSDLQHLEVPVSLSDRQTYLVDGPPTAYDPGSSCTDSTS
jgi:hypothetical protein